MLCGELVCVSLSEVSSTACLHAEEFREIKSEEVTASRRCRKMCDMQCCESLSSSAAGDTGTWSSGTCVAEVLGDHKRGLGEVFGLQPMSRRHMGTVPIHCPLFCLWIANHGGQRDALVLFCVLPVTVKQAARMLVPVSRRGSCGGLSVTAGRGPKFGGFPNPLQQC